MHVRNDQTALYDKPSLACARTCTVDLTADGEVCACTFCARCPLCAWWLLDTFSSDGGMGGVAWQRRKAV